MKEIFSYHKAFKNYLNVSTQKKNFFSELDLKQNGCIEVKSATGLYFLNIWGFDCYLPPENEKEEKSLDMCQL